MSAGQHKQRQYVRAQTPDTPLPLRRGEVQNRERLDERRIKQMREAAEKRRLDEERARISELESYYNMKNRPEAQQKGTRRRLNPAAALPQIPEYMQPKPQILKPEKTLHKRPLPIQQAGAPQAKNSQIKGSRAVNVGATILSIVLVFAMLSFVLVKQAQISGQTYLNSQLENKISALQTELSKINMDRALKEDLTSVQYAAGEKGMSRPSDTQIIFMNINPELPDNFASAGQGSFGEPQTAESADTESGADKAGMQPGVFEKIKEFFINSGKFLTGWLS